MVTLSLYGAAECVTGSNYLLNTPYADILIDCGLFQGSYEEEKHNQLDFPFEPKAIPFMILTHAHIDHSGRIPKLVKEGFTGKIICSKATRDLAEILLLDAAKIQEADAEWENKKRQRAGLTPVAPLYTTDDAYSAISYLYPVDTDLPIFLNEKIQVTMRLTGHLLGACSATLSIDGRHITFSGDMGTQQPILYPAPEPMPPSETLILESTYGNRLHASTKERLEKLITALEETLTRGGTAIIPAFSVGRTQQLLFDLYTYFKENPNSKLSNYPIYVDSPLAIDATDIYRNHLRLLKPEVQREFHSKINPFMQEKLSFVHDMKKSMALNGDTTPKIIISASGMCDAGRIRHHLKHYLWRYDTAIIFVGYQAQESLGRKILEGAATVEILGETIAVKARIYSLNGYSGHGDQNDLITWTQTNPKLKNIILSHGEREALDAMSERLTALGYNVTVPHLNDKIHIFD
jgi:metallo-beta-lactamase family protein